MVKYCGSAGGYKGKKGKNKFPIGSPKQCSAALSYSRYAPNPCGIVKCALNEAKRNNWKCGIKSKQLSKCKRKSSIRKKRSYGKRRKRSGKRSSKRSYGKRRKRSGKSSRRRSYGKLFTFNKDKKKRNIAYRTAKNFVKIGCIPKEHQKAYECMIYNRIKNMSMDYIYKQSLPGLQSSCNSNQMQLFRVNPNDTKC